MPELSEVLDLSLFGRGTAKTFQALEAEIACGESAIIWEADRPIRVVQVACVQVLAHTGEHLVEDRQEFADGRIRRRGLEGLSEKFQAGESPLEAARRALAEELGITTDLPLEWLEEVVAEKISPSYPGLLSRYHKYHFQVVLPASLYLPVYVEEQVSKKTFFRWQR